jgi:amino acid permease
VLLPFQLAVLVGIAVTYTVVGGDNLAAFVQGVAPHAKPLMGKWAYFIIFGAIQLLLSLVSCRIQQHPSL